ncbi:LacI family DNA-binding transcriptional regulator [Gulosibacter sp. 10]|uniref:LacI family DNA-binding transcriptional regulator n=1 Tax=Gulosibacter sp. 10 TaxID=1255570 RepID=UPI00097EAB48|nr:LacI family DNA-binding transcriptional regulator [Gulosibacter sp. 10]SJM71308.1 transcriptional regulator, LacI family [Gulosibacter sp. 10]
MKPSFGGAGKAAGRIRPKRPTIRDVAARAGVSKSLVSLVFSGGSVSEDRKQRVLAAAEELGYRRNKTARSLAGADGDFTGILVADLHNSVFVEIVEAARAEFSRTDRGALLTSAAISDADGALRLDRQALEALADLRPRSVLVVGTVPELEKLVKLVPQVPIVVASAIVEHLAVAATVRTDDWAGIRLAVEHLVGLGHERIAHIGGAGGAVARNRVAGYRAAMDALGLGGLARVEASDYTERGGYAATRRLLEAGERPTAITAVNDLSAIGALGAIAEAGLDGAIAVVGYDNTSTARLQRVSLTSVDPHNVEIGDQAARMVAALEDGEPLGRREVLVEPTLAVRDSSTMPR